MPKRIFDYVGAGFGLVLCAPLFLLIALAIKLTSRGPVFFRQERAGHHGSTFLIYKFRSMSADAPRRGASVTAGDDDRITPVGSFLRRHKLDELPQLINVCKGEMSLVGPRPEVKEFVDLFPEEYAKILAVRPGITHQGTLMFRNEEEILAGAIDPRARYLRFVMPLKLRVYMDNLHQPLTEELNLILATLLPSVWPRTYPTLRLDAPAVADLREYREQVGPAARPLHQGDKAMEEMA
jgi:lipopolysaccharide/colanic/teichoic acid biosynthesis glycosyltransferase